MTVPAPDKRHVPHVVHALINEKIAAALLRSPGVYRVYNDGKRQELLRLLRRWYEGDATVETSPMEDDRPIDRYSQAIHDLVLATVIDSFREHKIGITGVVAERLGIAPETVIDNPGQYEGLCNPSHPHALTLGKLKIGARIICFHRASGAMQPAQVVYIYQVGDNEVRVDIANKDWSGSGSSSDLGLTPIRSTASEKPRWSPEIFTILAEHRHTLPPLVIL